MAHGIGLHAGLRDQPHWVYRCFDADGALLYVGCTVNVAQRSAHHRTRSPWFVAMQSARLVGPFVGADARRRAMAVERHIIETESPVFNVKHLRKVA